MRQVQCPKGHNHLEYIGEHFSFDSHEPQHDYYCRECGHGWLYYGDRDTYPSRPPDAVMYPAEGNEPIDLPPLLDAPPR